MSPELQEAVQERVALGHSKEQITTELQAAGYDDASIDAIYSTVTSGVSGDQSAALQSLPRNRDLIKSAWSAMTSRMDLVGYLMIPTVAIAVFEYVSTIETVQSTPAALIAIAIAVIVSVGFAILFQMAVIHTAVTSSTGSEGVFRDSFNWAKTNIWGWLWLIILTMFIVLGGFFLLIIPGIVASIYVAFSQYVFVAEGKKGMEAVQRSRALVSGKFGSVVWRLFIMMLVAMAFYIPAGILIEIARTAFDPRSGVLVGTVIEAVFSAGIGVFVAFYMTSIFRSLQSMTVGELPPTKWLAALGVVGVVAVPLVILSIGAIVATMTGAYLMEEMGGVEETNITDFQVEQMELDAETQAELEAFQQQFEAEFESF